MDKIKECRKTLLRIAFMGLGVILAISVLAMVVQLRHEPANGDKVNFNGLAMNGFSLNGFSLNGMALNGMALNGLQFEGQTLTELSRHAAGKDLLKFIGQCALEEGTELVVPGEGGAQTFSGALGLAPEWVERALSSVEQRWVSACLLAHVNYFGAQVPISLRGEHRALSSTKEEENGFEVEEGAFYGNLFGKDPFLLSCTGSHETEAGPFSDLGKRVCATDVLEGKTVCGFKAAGQCRDVCEISPNGQGRGYTNCQIGLEEMDRVGEVITVYLRKGKDGDN